MAGEDPDYLTSTLGRVIMLDSEPANHHPGICQVISLMLYVCLTESLGLQSADNSTIYT
jgi:hypothetical protein